MCLPSCAFLGSNRYSAHRDVVWLFLFLTQLLDVCVCYLLQLSQSFHHSDSLISFYKKFNKGKTHFLQKGRLWISSEQSLYVLRTLGYPKSQPCPRHNPNQGAVVFAWFFKQIEHGKDKQHALHYQQGLSIWLLDTEDGIGVPTNNNEGNHKDK